MEKGNLPQQLRRRLFTRSLILWIKLRAEGLLPLVEYKHEVVWLSIFPKLQEHVRETKNRIRILSCRRRQGGQCIKGPEQQAAAVKNDKSFLQEFSSSSATPVRQAVFSSSALVVAAFPVDVA